MTSHPRVDPNQQKLPVFEERLLLWGMFRQYFGDGGCRLQSKAHIPFQSVMCWDLK